MIRIYLKLGGTFLLKKKTDNKKRVAVMFGKRNRSEADLGLLEAEIRRGDRSETPITLSNSPTGPALNKL